MDVGRRQLGQEVSFSVVSTAGEPGTPSWPSLPPILDIWRGNVLVAAGLAMPKVDPAAVGLFQRVVFLDSRFQLGRHEAVIRWLAGTYRGVKFVTFEVIDGGDANGDVIAMFHHQLPHARYLVMQTSAGKLMRAKNPNIPGGAT